MGFFLGIDITDITFDFSGKTDKLREKVKKILSNEIKEHWSQEEGPQGKFKDLRPATWDRKTTNKILLESGNYIRSWKAVEDNGEEIHIRMESDSELATFHELGTRDMPARSIAWYSEDTIATIMDLFGDEIEKTWEGE